MMAAKRVAVVTGGNKGIGLSIVKGLCQKFDGVVYLTARDETRGMKAVSELKEEGLDPKFHQLDVDNDESVAEFAEFLKKTHNGLDVLVNNAAIAFKHAATDPFEVQARETVKTNYFGVRRVCDALFPLLRPHARVVHVSSSSGRLSNVPGEALRKKLTDSNLTVDELDTIMQDFVDSAKSNTHGEKGWANSAYVASKVGLIALSMIHQRMFNKDAREDIVVNAVHPGYVRTDMTSQKGDLEPDQGAIAPTFLALLPENTDIKGVYMWYDKSIVSWEDGKVIKKN